jgi:hypothetical protein
VYTGKMDASALCTAAYSGQLCAQCASGYAKSNGLCSYCGNPSDQSAILALTLIAALSILLVLSVSITVLHFSTLAECVHIFCALQVIALVGTQGVKSIPFGTQQLTIFFTYFNLINFDVEVLRPGCSGELSDIERRSIPQGGTDGEPLLRDACVVTHACAASSPLRARLSVLFRCALVYIREQVLCDDHIHDDCYCGGDARVCAAHMA